MLQIEVNINPIWANENDLLMFSLLFSALRKYEYLNIIT